MLKTASGQVMSVLPALIKQMVLSQNYFATSQSKNIFRVF